METKNTGCIAFAYYGDNKFIGWYSDFFGTITPDRPKLYQNTTSQVSIIQKNFTEIVSTINKKSTLSERTGNEDLKLVDERINGTAKNLAQYKELELRAVICPVYEGLNPKFDKVKHEKTTAERNAKMKEEGIFNLPLSSAKRIDAVLAFDTKNPLPTDNLMWIYADRNLVKEWAAKEPTDFALIITLPK